MQTCKQREQGGQRMRAAREREDEADSYILSRKKVLAGVLFVVLSALALSPARRPRTLVDTKRTHPSHLVLLVIHLVSSNSSVGSTTSNILVSSTSLLLILQ
jgi:hypothetical protein